jgi:hypothetical protein
MFESSWLTSAQALQKQIESLIVRFSSLSQSAQDRVVGPLLRGEPPHATTLDDIRAAIADYQAVAAAAVELGLADQPPLDLPGLLTRLGQTIESESWGAIRESCRPEVERILRIVHKSGHAPPFLQEVHRRARQLIEELTSSSPPNADTRESWLARVQPF